MQPYVSVTKRGVYPVIKVDFRVAGRKRVLFPLTVRGCREAGRVLFESGFESWLNSSSVDFPQDVKEGCSLDVRSLMNEGFVYAREKQDAPRKRLMVKIMKMCDGEDFQNTLDPQEQAAFKIIKEAYEGVL